MQGSPYCGVDYMNSRDTRASITIPALIACVMSLLACSQVAVACPCGEIKAPESTTRSFTIPDGLAYMKSPDYKKEFARAVSNAKQACRKHLGEKDVSIVSDIDETVLDNSPYFIENPNSAWTEWNKWMVESKAPPLKPTADFLAWARKNGFAVFLITGRSENARKDTIANLLRAGIVYDGLYMRPVGEHVSTQSMKTQWRKQIADLGFKTIVNIGDQYSDLVGGYAEDCEKLPNKLYYVP